MRSGKIEGLIKLIIDNLRVLPFLAVLLIAVGTVASSYLKVMSNTQFYQNTNYIVLFFIAAMSVYILPIGHKVDNYFKNDKVTKISDDIFSLRTELEYLSELHSNLPKVKGLNNFKDKFIQKFTRDLKELKNEMRIKYLPPEESFSLSIEMLEKLKKGDEVIAITFMKDDEGEWENTILWNMYIAAQKKASQKKATVDRIFILEKERLRDNLKKEIMRIHTEGQCKEAKLNGFFMDKQNYNNLSRELKKRIGEGFILINSKSTDEMMSVLDNFADPTDPKHLDYRTTVTFNREADINPIISYFNEIKYMSMPLTKENLKKLDIEL